MAFPEFFWGGDETHGEQLHTQLAKQGIDVVARRKPYETKANRSASFDGVRFVDICAPRDKHFEAIILYLLGYYKNCFNFKWQRKIFLMN